MKVNELVARVALALILALVLFGATMGFFAVPAYGAEILFTRERAAAMEARAHTFRMAELPMAVRIRLLAATERRGDIVSIWKGEYFLRKVMGNTVTFGVLVSPESMLAERWQVYLLGWVYSAYLAFPESGPPYWFFKDQRDRSTVLARSVVQPDYSLN